MTKTYVFSGFGELVASPGVGSTPFAYKGAAGYYTNPVTNDIYVRARTCEPTTARWLSKDPLGFVDGPNLYGAYFAPGRVDPKGTSCDCQVVDAIAPYIAAGEDCGYYRMVIEKNAFFGLTFSTLFLFTGNCRCCEFRQYIRKAKFRINFHMPNGAIDECIFDPLGDIEPPGREDFDAVTGIPYGHREHDNSPGDEYWATRRDGCEYSSFDRPGIPFLWDKQDFCEKIKPARLKATHQTFYFSIAFDFYIYDFCKRPPKVLWSLGWQKTCELKIKT